MKKQFIKFALDLLMAVTFVLLFNDRVLGGLSFHEMAGLGIGVAFIVHVLLNAAWVKRVTMKMLDRKLPWKTRFEYGLNLLLLVSMAFIIFSGIIISRIVFPQVTIGNETWFKATHISVSFLVLAIVGVHVGLHWNWVMNMVKKMAGRSSSSRAFGIALKLAMVAVLAFGIYEMTQTSYVQRLSSVGSAFGSASAQGGPGGMDKGFGMEGRGDRGFRPDAGDSADNGGNAGGDNGVNGDSGINGTSGINASSSNSDNGSSSAGTGSIEGNGSAVDGANGTAATAAPQGFRGGRPGEGGRGESANPLNVLATYLGMMGVFVILAYYLNKLITRKKPVRPRTKPSPTAES